MSNIKLLEKIIDTTIYELSEELFNLHYKRCKARKWMFCNCKMQKSTSKFSEVYNGYAKLKEEINRLKIEEKEDPSLDVLP